MQLLKYTTWCLCFSILWITVLLRHHL